jgi:hypothetical protein
LAREARTNRRRACVLGLGLAVGTLSAPLMAEYNRVALAYLGMYVGALVPLLLCVAGQLLPYEDSWHEFQDTYVNPGHTYLWPVYTAYEATFGVGLTNFMVVEIGVVACAGFMALATSGVFDVGCVLLCSMTAVVSWFFSSCLKLHWY